MLGAHARLKFTKDLPYTVNCYITVEKSGVNVIIKDITCEDYFALNPPFEDNVWTMPKGSDTIIRKLLEKFLKVAIVEV
jgi:hypothetical protein